MSEAMEKVQGIEHLAVFPLPLVLLPNELLPLHIFEPRYRQMFQDIELERNLFGISFFDGQDAFTETPPIGSIGCVAEVRDVQKTPDERSNILTVGIIRYRLLEYIDSGAPYLTAKIVFFEDADEDQNLVRSAADEIFELFERIAKAAFRLSGNRGNFPEIQRAEPEPMSFLVAAAFNLDNELKYRLTEMTSTIERFERLKEILIPATTKMEESSDINKSAQTNGHSKTKIDIP
ncbi:MAG: LON peptidase substrate-binding domain-containing protein [Saprospiraceae bacterium]|nr:LON peptidase substrate-binding domain-containing protein [Pyrinomonadaceae bacterium]